MSLRKSKMFRGLSVAQGSEIAETAMILPLFFMLFLAIFWFGEAFSIYGTLAHATRLGAEAAVNPPCTTCTATTTAAQNAQAAVYSALAASHLSKNNLVIWTGASPKWTAPPLCACPSSTSAGCTTATCDASIGDVCVRNIQLSYTAQKGMGVCGTSVSVRYQIPFSLPIPQTALDLSKFLLPGQAQMRAESQ